MSNPAGKAAKKQTGIDNSYATDFNNRSNAVNGQLFPFLSNELNHPQGFGDDTVSKMKTEGGEAVQGAQGQATEAAGLLGSRTGNTAVAPGIIDVASRDAMKQNSNNALGVDIANAKAKMIQQQEAAGGLGGQYSTDVGAALNSLGLANGSISNQNAAYGNSFTGKLMGGLGSGISGAATNPFNYDPSNYGNGGCWIAEAIWGVEDPRTHLVRAWLNLEYKKSRVGALVMAAYLRFGRRVAAGVRKSRALRWLLTPLFEKALVQAKKWSVCR